MASAMPELRAYPRADVVSFRKTSEEFGGLSNMAPGYPIHLAGVRIPTSEALYQACRFPHMPEVQEMIISQTSPMTAKMRSKPYRPQSRPDWDHVRVPIMKWCLRVKLVQNWSKFGDLLLRTGDRQIVEDSSKDDFWGAMREEEGVLRGRNVLGRLLMELREKLRTAPESLEIVAPVPIAEFTLFSLEIPSVARVRPKEAPTIERVQEAPGLFEFPLDNENVKADPVPIRDAVVSDQPAPVDQRQAESAIGDITASARQLRRRLAWLAVGAILLGVIIWWVVGK